MHLIKIIKAELYLLYLFSCKITKSTKCNAWLRLNGHEKTAKQKHK